MLAASLLSVSAICLRNLANAAGFCSPWGFAEGFNKQLLAGLPERREVLALAHQHCQRIGAARKAQAHLLDCGRGRGLFCPLRHDKGFAAELSLWLEPLFYRLRDIVDMAKEIIRPLFHEPAGAFSRRRASSLGGCVGNDGGRGLARIGERVRGVAAAGVEASEVVEHEGRTRIVGPDDLLLDRERAFEEWLGLAEFGLVKVKEAPGC